MVQRFLSALNGDDRKQAKSLVLKHYGSWPQVFSLWDELLFDRSPLQIRSRRFGKVSIAT
jgi:hypothetical protein